MVIYLDLIFILNALADGLALYITAHLSALAVRNSRLLIASLFGGVYSVLCSLPLPVPIGGVTIQTIVAVLMLRLTFGQQKTILRLLLLFYFLSCAFGGAMMLIYQQIAKYGVKNTLQNANWKVFFLVGISCYFLLSMLFRRCAKHIVAGELCRVYVTLRDQKVKLSALYDTGNTLIDPYNGLPILTVWYRAVDALWSKEERTILDQLEVQGSVGCAEKLGEISSARFHLVPYRAVGIACAMLLTFQASDVYVDHKQYKRLTVALSPTPVSDGGGYTALWGGERNIRGCYIK